MNNNKICNPKVEVPKGINLNDKDYLTILLTCLKDMEKNYVIALTEASNENLYSKYMEIFNSLSYLQREVYEMMFRNGWYQLEKAEETKVSQKCQTLNQEYNELEM